MRTIKKSIFAFSELSDTAKEKAREWYRQDLPVDYDFVFEDAANIADILGLDIRQTRKETMKGEVHYAPTVFFSGFWSQGAGACFEGRYSYKKGWKKTLKAFCNDAEMLRIGQALQDLQKKHFYRLGASIKHSGRYYHEYSMTVDCEHFDDTYRDLAGVEEEFKEVFADFARWIYKRLEAEYGHANAGETIDEALELGEFEFYENGDVFLGVKKLVNRFNLGGVSFCWESDWDGDCSLPWVEFDGVGVVLHRYSARKAPHEVLIRSEVGCHWFYDVRASMSKARKEAWGLSEGEAVGLTKRQVIAKAIKADMDYCKEWAKGGRDFVYIKVWAEEQPEVVGYLGGIEHAATETPEHLISCAHDVAWDLLRESQG